MNMLIVSGGDLGDVDYIKENSPDWDMVLCADSGARHMEELGIVPDLLVGDLDSISPSLLKKYGDMGIPIKTYPEEKDETDTQIAVDIAMDMGAKWVYIVGALGNRWDHSYANIMLLYRLEKRGVKAKILHSHNTIQISRDILEIEAQIGQDLSLLPFTGDVLIESTQGLAYPLKDSILTLDFPIGVSNVFTEKRATIRVGSGWVIAILTKD